MFAAVPLFILLVGAIALFMWAPLQAALFASPILAIFFYRRHAAATARSGFGRATLRTLAPALILFVATLYIGYSVYGALLLGAAFLAVLIRGLVWGSATLFARHGAGR